MNVNLQIIGIFAVLTALLAAPAVIAADADADAKPPEPAGKLVLAIAPGQPYYLKGTPVRVRLLMENGGTAPIFRKELPLLIEGVWLVDTVTGKSYVPQVEPGDSAAVRKPDLLVQGAFYGRTVNLTEWFREPLSKEGTYTLQWTHDGVRAEPVQIIISGDYYVTLHTKGGDVDVEVAFDRAPLGSSSFLDMMNKGAFKGASIAPPGDGSPWVDVIVPPGKIPKKPLATELSETLLEEGAVIFFPLEPLNDSNEETGGVSGEALMGTKGYFRILTAPGPRTNERYARVGRVIRGMELLKTIHARGGTKPSEPAGNDNTDKKQASKKEVAARSLAIESAELKPYKDRREVKVPKTTGTLEASLSVQYEEVAYGEPIYARFTVSNRGDWKVRTKQKISLTDGLTLVDMNQKEYQPVIDANLAQTPQPDPVVERGEFFGVTVDVDKMFPQLETGGDFALQWKRDDKQRALTGLTVHLIHHVRVTVEGRGEFVMELFNEETPRTVAAFETLVREGFYNGTIFHHVINTPELKLVQGGGLPNDDQHVAKIAPLSYEQGRHAFNAEGIVGLAHRIGRKDEGVSQFFICLGAAPARSGLYTPFGRVTEGMEIVKAIRRGDKIQQIELFYRKGRTQ